MHPILRNILAVIAGIIVGGVANYSIITIGGSIVPLPEGVDPSDMENLKESIHQFQPKHFIPIFLAHAVGALLGAFIASKLAVSYQLQLALAVGTFFLLGGIMMVFSLPSPMWFNIVDLVGAYLPMAWLGNRLATSLVKK